MSVKVVTPLSPLVTTCCPNDLVTSLGMFWSHLPHKAVTLKSCGPAMQASVEMLAVKYVLHGWHEVSYW